ncbi:aldehyde ferredoxin oxidoreductase [Haloprofundus marisrubri]|uniref:Aldehyde ferredoxin oxidoreductase n=1 Tax=Haloprofundus marisrubri TaxID=1514971 RepID=A0A0W1R7B1_9EURY|nr:aldehyde ferredoxin oxidoreductase C-terminal domain-containing protein [Haloprofundus marisrubri]KTG09105.1 aldehyde ferredoxin oxidoreductase [Haloprofundus marisrubri]
MTTSTRDAVLRVDLSTETVERERVPDEWRRDYLGGKGLGARYLYADLAPGVDPLGPDNLLCFMLGPLSGYLPGETRYAAVTKSPLTGGFLDSYSGGSFPERLAGSLDDCLGILVTGRAERPVTLVVADGTATIEPAGDRWGDDTVETDAAFPDAAVACIGPAGESEVAYATIASDAGDHHAGRGGAGAVMGSKRLKAVVARGDAPELPTELRDLREQYERRYEDHETGRWQAAGETLESVDFANEVGVLATEGWQRGQFDAAENIGIEAAREAAVGREHDSDPAPGGFRVPTEGSDHESVPRGAAPMTLGAGLGMEEFDAVAALGETCDRLGIDVISAGNAVAWAIRAADAELLDTDARFGDESAARRLLAEIATREGELADALADGVADAAERYGGEALVPTVKSMELPSYDPRGAIGMALAYATSDRGACHRRARPVEREVFETWDDADVVDAVAGAQTVRSVLWSLVADDFVGETMWDDLGAAWLDAVGLPHDAAELSQTGERIWTLVRLFNVREGFDRSDDTLPDALRRPLTDGPAAGRAIDPEAFDRLLDAYYVARGWGPDGRPTEATVERLGLGAVVDDATPLAEQLQVDVHFCDFATQ